jgi:hypothetical protein
MRYPTTAAALLSFLAVWAIGAEAQGWEVEAEILLEDSIDPAQDESQNFTQNEQPKVFSYEPIILIETASPDEPGDARIDYSKDSDPYGDFEITITSESVGDVKVWYRVEHNIVDLSGGTWSMRTTLEVERIDLDGDEDVRVMVNPDGDFGVMLMPRVWVDDGLFAEWVEMSSLVLGNAFELPLTGEGTTQFQSGDHPYNITDESTRMAVDGDFMLSSGDRVIVRGRFEFFDPTPVESVTWGAIKAQYNQ